MKIVLLAIPLLLHPVAASAQNLVPPQVVRFENVRVDRDMKIVTVGNAKQHYTLFCNVKAAGCITPYVDAPLARTFLTCPQIGRLQPYVRPLCATGLAAGPDDNRGSDPRSRHRALRRWSPRAFPIPGLAGLHHVSIALPN